ncbi:hypothetical protein [Alkalihalobacillus sp. BA299]|uniref:hypothetical protein n=1 Tax=Alkalihalobacillus sp. BA299 TaxID=2815938 RepID=UPI001ADC2953|nr:hypothetical protein [Alkalihalobacillus sp. BA299]
MKKIVGGISLILLGIIFFFVEWYLYFLYSFDGLNSEYLFPIVLFIGLYLFLWILYIKSFMEMKKRVKPRKESKEY